MKILITSAGQRVSLVRAFKKELTKHFNDAKVFATDMNPGLSPACNISDKYFKVKRVIDPQYIDELLSLCIENEIKMVIPTIDMELQVLADHKHLFDNINVHLIISSSSFVATCGDKRKTNKLFLQNKIPIPAEIDKKNLSFPLFIKPFDGSLSSDTYLIRREKELTDYHLENEKFMFMEYLDKITYQEYTIDMYYGRDHFVKCIVPRKRILVRAGEINKGLTCKNLIVTYLKEKLAKIEGAVGCVTTQLFLNRETQDLKAIEINPRFGGGYILSYLAGANFPKWLIEEYLQNKEIDYTDSWEDNLLMLRYDDEILIHDYKDY
ncbi:MAG TPA: ATP-grasp domain-containing protein [Chitinophagaceae bacterium]|nr:ATP-grasp domain-containing protein [Chitinophagaceae bacterium]